MFVEGIASGLRRQLPASELRTINSRGADTLAQVVAARPALVITDAADDRLEQVCPLSGLLAAFPKLTVIRLDPQQERMQVITSEYRLSGEISGLIRTIQSVIR
jgi:hypothetical protein